MQVATVVNNHMTSAILKYFGEAFRYDRAANLFERLLSKDPELVALVARAYMGMSKTHSALRRLS